MVHVGNISCSKGREWRTRSENGEDDKELSSYDDDWTEGRAGGNLDKEIFLDFVIV